VTADVVADIGNTRIKWGLCQGGKVTAMASLPPDDGAAWHEQTRAWSLVKGANWVLAGVHPARRDRLAAWLRQQGHAPTVIDSYRDLPLVAAVETPERVGLDRLLNAVAANAVRRPGEAAVIVDAGSAVTVDLVDQEGVFRGGAIFPGFRLMSLALHQYTAQLPLVEIKDVPVMPGASTEKAIAAGILGAVAGGIDRLAREAGATQPSCSLFLTGGDAALVAKILNPTSRLWPEMTLEGLRLAAAKHVGNETAGQLQ
jgi:type III pantothenate kinase